VICNCECVHPRTFVREHFPVDLGHRMTSWSEKAPNRGETSPFCVPALPARSHHCAECRDKKMCESLLVAERGETCISQDQQGEGKGTVRLTRLPKVLPPCYGLRKFTPVGITLIA